jgi:hypothetical protein
LDQNITEDASVSHIRQTRGVAETFAFAPLDDIEAELERVQEGTPTKQSISLRAVHDLFLLFQVRCVSLLWREGLILIDLWFTVLILQFLANTPWVSLLLLTTTLLGAAGDEVVSVNAFDCLNHCLPTHFLRCISVL